MKNLLARMLDPYKLCLIMVLMAQTGWAIDLNGKWNFVFDTDDGERQDSAVFHLDGHSVSGRWGRSETQVKGTFVDGKLELKFPFVSEEGGLEGDLMITGKLDGQRLTGTWEFSGYTGTFVAKHSEESK